MSKLVSLRFVKRYENLNAGEVAGFPEEEAHRIVARGFAGYRNLGDIPAEIAKALEEEGADEGEAAAGTPAATGPTIAPPPNPSALPEDFPAREALIEAGIDTIGAVPRTEEALMAIKGIGVGFAQRILKALAEE